MPFTDPERIHENRKGNIKTDFVSVSNEDNYAMEYS